MRQAQFIRNGLEVNFTVVPTADAIVPALLKAAHPEPEPEAPCNAREALD